MTLSRMVKYIHAAVSPHPQTSAGIESQEQSFVRAQTISGVVIGYLGLAALAAEIQSRDSERVAIPGPDRTVRVLGQLRDPSRAKTVAAGIAGPRAFGPARQS